ncbi:MAG: PAS-domain containing protein, partial [Sphingomonas sp.]|nr:PAS-domain containing protein [Sphingomonas sp.]
MIQLSAVAAVLVGATLALLIAVAGWTLLVALREKAQGKAALTAQTRLEALLATAPALAMVVRADGRLEMPVRLADWLGFAQVPRFLDDLAGSQAGLNADDFAALSGDIAAAQKSAGAFTRSIRPQGAQRTLIFKGQRAARDLQAPGGVVLWVLDATESETEIARLGVESARVSDAYQALLGLIEAAPLPMWYRGPDLRLLMVNSAYVEAVDGADAEDVVARGVELVEGSGMGGPLANAVRAREAARPHAQAMPATIRGARRMLRVFDVPLTTGGVAGFAIDIEELEEARSGIKRFGEAQRALLDRLSAGVVQFAPDRTLAFCNQPFRRLFAMRTEWLSDRPEFDRVLERMREAGRLPEVRDFPGWKTERRDWFATADEQIEENWHLPGGTHLRVVAQPLPDGGLLMIFEDRTEQIQLASARDTLLRVRTATFDNLFEALGVFAADGRLQLWNNRFRLTLGLEEEFLAEHPRVDVLANAAAARLASPGKAVLISELVRSATVQRLQRGGDLAFADGRHFEFAAVPLPDGNALFTMLDVSDRRKIEHALRERNDALEAADRVKTAFVANMSYELRTPLTSISGFAEMLKGGYAGTLPPTADEYVAAILESVERLGGLVDDVLDLTSSEGGQSQIEPIAVAIETMARAAAKRIEDAIKGRRLDFAIEIAPTSGTVRGDARRLTQVVENMLRHAIS